MINEIEQKELRNRFNPDGSPLRIFQLQTLDILIKVDEFCREHNIRYWLSSGTMLGAARHGGFIPWDDDIDIDMFEDDYKKFVDMANKYGLPDGLVLQNQKTDKYYYLQHAKVRNEDIKARDVFTIDKDYLYQGIFIDIFPLRKCVKCIIKPFSIFEKILAKLQIYIKPRFLRRLILQLYHFVFFILLIKPIAYIASKLGTVYYDSLGSRWSPCPRKKEDILPLKECEFENHKFYCPNNVDNYLKAIYGDWEKLPDLNKIKVHTVL